MEINRRTLAPIYCASTDETRFTINSLHFAADGSTVATNKHILARCVPKTSIGHELQPFTLWADTLAELQREQMKARAIPAKLDIDATNGNGYARVTGVSGAREIPKLDGDFPDWRHAHPKETPDHKHRVLISLANLEKIVAAGRQFTASKKGETIVAAFEFTDEHFSGNLGGPIRAEIRDCESGDVLEFSVMPCFK
jgi:DNA polymerase III sliding clamp (beta) subunit (PCNA family)